MPTYLNKICPTCGGEGRVLPECNACPKNMAGKNCLGTECPTVDCPDCDGGLQVVES